MSIQIEVVGSIPRPGGSKKSFGKGKMAPASEHTAVWRSDVTNAVLQQYKGELLTTNIEVTYEFRFPRPKHHFKGQGQTGVLKENAPFWHTSTPDLTKIIRSTEDALTSLVWEDDKQVCLEHGVKRYCFPGERPGVSILIEARK